jgi:dipeptidyl aminopeptidase/acylaminoacyl peptidase
MKNAAPFAIGSIASLILVCSAAAATTAQLAGPPAPATRPATVEDSVRLRTFAEESPVAVSPDGKRVAYLLIEPNLQDNYDQAAVYVRELPEAGQTAQREAGKPVLRTRGARQMQWLADGQHLLVLHQPDGENGSVVRVDLSSGESSPVSPAGMDVEEFAATPDGRRLALLVNAPDVEQADRFAAPRGVVITPDDFLLDIDARGTAKTKATRMAIVAADVAAGALIVFPGKRSLSLMRPAISPDGKYLTFHSLGEALAYPSSWQKDPAFRQWPSHGFIIPPNELIRAQLPATIPPATAPGSTAPAVPLSFALDAGCISDQFWGMALLWSDDSTKYLVCGPAPVGDGASLNEPLEGPFRPHHLFAIDATTGAAQRVMDQTPQEVLVFDDQARRIVVRAADGDIVILRKTDAAAGKWTQQQRIKIPASGLRDLAASPADPSRLVGIHQTPTEPPDLWLLDPKTGHKAALTEINPELREQSLGKVEMIKWLGGNKAKNWGYVIYPVGYQAGTRYPCAILCKTWDNTFIHGGNGGLRSNLAPQALANSGILVLMLGDSAGPYPRGTWKNLPGGISEAFRGMDAFETAKHELDRRGLIDPSRVGIMGFSRSSWIVDFTLTHSKETWAAAVSADSGIYNYETSFMGDQNLRSGMAAMYGGPPYGDSFKAWLDYAPAFAASHVRTPLLMQYHGKVSMAAELYSSLITEGKPVELVLFPEGEHILQLPLQRVGSMQGSVDWFRFWLQGWENPHPQYPDQYERWRALKAQHEWNEKLIAAGQDPSKEFIEKQNSAGSH